MISLTPNSPASWLRLISFCLPSVLGAVVPAEYALTDISGWSDIQLAGLPFFERFVPLSPPEASADFRPVAHNGLGVVAGNRDFSNTWVQGSGASIRDGVQTDIPAWLWPGNIFSYAWSYTWWDGTDYHFQNGFVTHSPVMDLNAVGLIVGYATIPGSGSGAGSSLAYSDHGYIVDAGNGSRIDFTPEAERAQPRAINDYGEVTGTWSNDLGYHAFRRSEDGMEVDFLVPSGVASPSTINNHGHIAGMATVYSLPRVHYPFFSGSGTGMIPLPYPPQNSPDTGSVADINDHDVIVGEAHKSDAILETSAVRWTQSGGTWNADDLNELLVGNFDFILDRCLAVNDAGHIIASGHLDGGPDSTYNTHLFLLTPAVLQPPAVTTLPARSIKSTSAVLRAKINAAGLPADYHLEYGESVAYGQMTPVGSAGGTWPVLAELEVTGLAPHSTYFFRAAGTNAEGSTTGRNLSFTTAWDWASWAAEFLGATAPEGDANYNGHADLLDYATAGDPSLFVVKSGDTITCTFQHNSAADGVEIVLQLSNDLSTWHDGPRYSLLQSVNATAHAVEVSRTPLSAETERITVSAVSAASPSFFRLTAHFAGVL